MITALHRTASHRLAGRLWVPLAPDDAFVLFTPSGGGRAGARLTALV